MTNLWKRDHYDAYCDYVFGRKIVEYDISKANISILRDAGKISNSEYLELFQADRMMRQYAVGCKIRDDESLNEVLRDGFTNARKTLCEKLDLEDNNILHVNKDAIFVVLPVYQAAPDKVQAGDYTWFTKRSLFHSYYRVSRGLHLYVDKDGMYKIRGMSEAAIELHKDYFLRILLAFAMDEIRNGVRNAYERARLISEEFNTYDYHFFRRFDSQSLYDFKQMSIFSNYQVEYVDEGSIDMIDPSYNFGLIGHFGNIYLSSMITRG